MVGVDLGDQFPKMAGRRLSERLGRLHFAAWVVGFTLTFLPQYLLGFAGMPRRIADYPADVGWNELNLASTAGTLLLAVGTVPFFAAIVLAFRRPATAEADPWGGNTLEWATSSPPPHHNFEHLPRIRSKRPVFDARMAAVGGVAGDGGAVSASSSGSSPGGEP